MATLYLERQKDASCQMHHRAAGQGSTQPKVLMIMS
jgi:hypothetical protein